MDILISFTTSVGVTQAINVVKNVVVEIVNQSIVLSLKNKKVPHPARPGDGLNNRDINYTNPPDSYYKGFYKLLRVGERRTDYQYDTWAPGVPWRIIEIDVETDVWTNKGVRKVKFTFLYPDGNISHTGGYEESVSGLISRYCSNGIWGACVYNTSDASDGSYFVSFYSATVRYLVYPL